MKTGGHTVFCQIFRWTYSVLPNYSMDIRCFVKLLRSACLPALHRIKLFTCPIDEHIPYLVVSLLLLSGVLIDDNHLSCQEFGEGEVFPVTYEEIPILNRTII